MGITSQSFVITICVVAVLAIVAVPVLWDRWKWHKTFRSVTVLFAAVVTVFAAGILVNVQGDFFPTWNSLVGGDSSGLATGSAGVEGDLGNTHGRQVVAQKLQQYAHLARNGNGVVVRADFGGAKSHINRPGAVYLPAAYFNDHDRNVEFPVIELLSGSPGDPAGELKNLKIAQFLDQEIHAHRMPPTIAVIPSTNPSALADDECVNAVGGDQDDTYLTTDIRNDVIRDYRVQSDRQSWALMGYSTGGYCAVNLSVRHPDYYASAISFSGYFYPITDYTTGDLYNGDNVVKEANAPLHTLLHEKVQPAMGFFLVAGSAEHGPPGQMRTLLSELRPPASGEAVLVPNGGHSWAPWRQELGIALDWVGDRFGGALAPALRPSHGETVTIKSGDSKPTTTKAGGRSTLPPVKQKKVAQEARGQHRPAAAHRPVAGRRRNPTDSAHKLAPHKILVVGTNHYHTGAP
jgi:enterochelin esterase-like enzyme